MFMNNLSMHIIIFLFDLSSLMKNISKNNIDLYIFLVSLQFSCYYIFYFIIIICVIFLKLCGPMCGDILLGSCVS